MPMVRAMRLVNSIEAGNTNSATLQQALTNGGVLSDFNSVLQLPGQCNVLATSTTALGAISGSTTATTAAVNSPYLNNPIVNNSTSRSYLQSSGRPLLQGLANANQSTWIPNANYPTQGASLNNVVNVNGTGACYEVAYGNGVYVAIPSSGQSTYTSTDGINWTTNTSALPTSTTWASITFGNGYFVAVAGYSVTSTVAAYSTNGVTWTSATLPSSSNWTSVAFGNISGTNYFVAIAGGAGSATTVNAYSTNNGATWTAGSALSSSATWQRIVFGNGTFVVTAGQNKAGGGSASSSTSYTTNPTSSWTAGGALSTSALWGQLAFGTISATPYFVVIASTGAVNYSTNNGVTWTAGTSLTSNSWYGLAFGNGYFVATSSGGTCAYSTSGTAFTKMSLLSNNGVSYGAYVTYGTAFVSVNQTANDNGILTAPSTGLPTSTPTTASIFATYSYTNFYSFASAYGNGTYVIAGPGAVYTSTDAVTWTKTLVPIFTVSGGNPTSIAYGVINGVGYFMCVCSLALSSQIGAYSTNGTTWQYAPLPSSALWSSVAYGTVGGTPCFIAVAGGQLQYGGTSANTSSGASSTNGTTWGTFNLGSSHQWCSVAIGNNYVVAIPNDVANLYDYTNTLSGFSEATSTLAVGSTSIVYANNYFLVANSNSIYYITTAGLSGAFTPLSLSWTPWALGTNGSTVIAYTQGATGTGTNVYAYYSTTPTTSWTFGSLVGGTNSGSVGQPLAITYGNGLFLSTNPTSVGSSPLAITSY